MSRPLASLPDLETERLSLRPLRQVDAAAFRAMTDEPAIIDAVHFLAQPFGLADAATLIVGNSDGRDCFWGAWRRGAAGLIGTVGTHLIGVDEVEIGYWFAAAARGQGLASEAVTGVASALAAAYPERRIFAECRPQNDASWRLLERVGFRADGGDGARPDRKKLVLHR